MNTDSHDGVTVVRVFLKACFCPFCPPAEFLPPHYCPPLSLLTPLPNQWLTAVADQWFCWLWYIRGALQLPCIGSYQPLQRVTEHILFCRTILLPLPYLPALAPYPSLLSLFAPVGALNDGASGGPRSAPAWAPEWTLGFLALKVKRLR